MGLYFYLSFLILHINWASFLYIICKKNLEQSFKIEFDLVYCYFILIESNIIYIIKIFIYFVKNIYIKIFFIFNKLKL